MPVHFRSPGSRCSGALVRRDTLWVAQAQNAFQGQPHATYQMMSTFITPSIDGRFKFDVV